MRQFEKNPPKFENNLKWPIFKASVKGQYLIILAKTFSNFKNIKDKNILNLNMNEQIIINKYFNEKLKFEMMYKYLI